MGNVAEVHLVIDSHSLIDVAEELATNESVGKNSDHKNREYFGKKWNCKSHNSHQALNVRKSLKDQHNAKTPSHEKKPENLIILSVGV